MLRSVQSLVLPALQARLVLLVNHVLSREPIAMQRLQAHAGRRVRIEPQGVPAWWPAPPAAVVAITPAGLFDVDDADSTAVPDLHLRVAWPDLSVALAAMAGEAQPKVQVDGDAALAAEMHWLVDNVRWDLESDLAEAVGPAVAHQVVRTGRATAGALRSLVPTSGSDRR